MDARERIEYIINVCHDKEIREHVENEYRAILDNPNTEMRETLLEDLADRLERILIEY